MIQQLKDAIRYHTPDALYPAIAMPYFHVHPERDTTVIRKRGELWEAKNVRRARTLWYPVVQNAGRASKFGLEKGRLYQLPGTVEVEPGDVVVDTGAYVGEFTAAVAPTAGRILAIEPEPTSAKCLRANTREYDHVVVERALLDSVESVRPFHVGTDPTENSIFELDAGSETGVVEMETRTLSDVCSQYHLDEIDFLKLEAEGAEPEILEGADGVSIRKIAAGVGPERNGESTRSRVMDLLLDRGFEVRGENRNVLFATSRDDD